MANYTLETTQKALLIAISKQLTQSEATNNNLVELGATMSADIKRAITLINLFETRLDELEKRIEALEHDT